MSRHSHGCGRGPCFAAGAAALLLATASSAASRERESVWYGVGLLAGATQLDPHLGDFQWDVRPRAAWGAEALAGRGRWAGGVRAWRATSTQTLGPSGTTSADVAVTTLEVLGQTRVASIAATDLLATANAGGLWLGYRPDQVTITPAGSSTPIVVDLAPVQEWVAGAGLSLRRPVAGHWSASLAVDVQLFALDAAHRNGGEIEIERESFGDWSARLGLAWLPGAHERDLVKQHPVRGRALRRLALWLWMGALAAGSAEAQSSVDSVAADPASTAAESTIPPTVDSTASAPRPAFGAALHGSPRVRLDRSAQNVVRTGPGDGFAIAGVFPKGAEFAVVAKSGDWYNVRLSGSETGWIHASLCKEFDDLSAFEYKPNPKVFTRTGSFILTGYTGAYAFDRKSNSLVLGGRLGYYVFDRVQAEGGVGWTHVHRPAEIVESLFDLSLEAEDFDMLFYHLILTWEILPGRQMVPFVSGGVGSTLLLGRSEPAFNVGAGTTLFLSKRTAMRWEFRDYVFRTGADDARASTNNIEFTLGTSMLF